MATRMQQRRGTAAQWISLNNGDGPILAAGEIGFESDTGQFKIGDGISHWIDLSYFKNLEDLGGSLDDYILLTEKGAASGVAELDATFNVLTKTGVVFEGATANEFETTLQVTDPTADRTITIPNATGTVLLADGSGNVTVSGDLTVSGTTTIIDSTILNVQNEIKFEGLTANAFETSLTVVDPTADRTITLPDATGTVVLADGTQTLSNKTINLNANTVSGTIAQFNTAVSDADLATIAGTETLTNKTLTSATVNSPLVNEAVALTATATELNILDGATLSTVELNYVDGVTSAIQTQLNNKQDVIVGLSATELGYLDGVTSAIQTQIDAKAPLASPTFTGTVTLPANTITQSMMSDDSVGTNEIGGLSVTTGKIADGAVTTAKLGDDSVTSAKIVAGTIVNSDINSAAAIDWTKLAVSSTVSSTELGYVDGVTSSIQTQLNGKQATVANVSDVEIGYLDGVTSSIQTQLDAKAPLASPTFTGTVTLPSGTVTSTMILDGTIVDGDISSSAAIATSKISGLDTALTAKAPLASPTFTGTVTIPAGASISGFAPLASPALTGTPTAPTAAATTNTTQVATTAYVRGEISALVNSATSTLDTLGEIATALGNDANLSTTLTTSIGLKAPIASPTFTGTVTIPAGASISGFAPLASPTFTGTSNVAALTASGLITASASGVAFTDGTQTKEGVPSRTPIVQKTDSYTLSALTERDSLIEVSKATATTITIPTNTAVAYPVGTSIDILQTGAGQVTIAGDTGVTVNSTPGLKLRTQWSSATLFKRAANTWVVFGDLTA